MLGVREFIQKITVVSQKDQSIGVRIQPPHRAQHGAAGQFDQFRDQAGRMNIAAGTDNVARLIDGNVIAPLGGPHAAAIADNNVARGIYFDTELGHDFAVDPDSALLNPLFARPARGDSGVREDFLEPFARGCFGGRGSRALF